MEVKREIEMGDGREGRRAEGQKGRRAKWTGQ